MSVGAQSHLAGEAEVRRLRVLYRLLSALSHADALEAIYEAALTSLLDATGADRAAILLFDDDGVIRFKACRGLSREYQEAVTGHSPWDYGTLGARTIVIPDVREDTSLRDYRDVVDREGIRALAFVPLVLKAGVFGKFMLYYSEPHECSKDELEIAEAIAAHVALATEHKRAEAARMRVEQRMQAILDNSAAVIFQKDLQGRYLHINRHFEELFHVTRSEALGRTDHEIFPSQIADRFRANDRAVLAAGKPLAMEEYAPHDDGIHTYISVKFPLAEVDGTVTGLCGIATDITDRKHLEAASGRLAAIVESSNDAILSKNLDGIITSWNAGAENIYGYTAAEIVGQPVAILAATGNHNEMPEILSKIRQGQRVQHYETRRRRKDGRVIDVSLTVSPIQDATGQIVAASSIARDISDLKFAEQERAVLLSRQQEAARIAELLNRVGPQLAGQLDPEKLVQEVTDIATALVEAEFGSFFLNVFDEKSESYKLYALSGVSREAFEGFPISRNEDLFGATFDAEAVVRCDDMTQDPRYPGMAGRQLSIRSYLAVPVIARSGEVLGGLFFGHSLPSKFTEAHEAIVIGIAAQTAIYMDNARLFEQGQWVQAELKRSNEELRRANQDLESFAYSASHDLQEPLRSIAISAQLIERNWGGQTQVEHAIHLAKISAAARRMNTLIEDLLAYTRATKYEQGPPPRVDAHRVLTDVLEDLRGPIEEASAEVTVGKLPTIAIHEVRLAQVFQNLISNAIKYRSETPPRVHVAAEERDGWYVFSVIDNGIGIEPQFSEQIFGLFRRLHGRSEYPGSGIGLAICQRVVEQYGGRIWLEQSAPGAGSTFCFLLPSRI